MPHDPREIANFILDVAEELHIDVTHLKLQKLVFFAHGWHLAIFGQPLVDELFEAWRFGPVSRSIYTQFSRQRAKNIRERAKRFDIFSGEYEEIEYSLSLETNKFIRDIISSYANENAYRLSDRTHEAGSPWDQIYNASSLAVNLGMKIPDELIAAHFRADASQRSRH